jgi:Bacterial SH3 domain.
VASIKIKIKRPDSSTFRSWWFVLVAGVLLTLIALFDSGKLAAKPLVPPADGSTGCQFRVTVAEGEGRRVLNVRSAPDLNAEIRGTLDDGTLVDVVGRPINGFRELEGGLYASADHLTHVSGTDCG